MRRCKKIEKNNIYILHKSQNDIIIQTQCASNMLSRVFIALAFFAFFATLALSDTCNSITQKDYSIRTIEMSIENIPYDTISLFGSKYQEVSFYNLIIDIEKWMYDEYGIDWIRAQIRFTVQKTWHKRTPKNRMNCDSVNDLNKELKKFTIRNKYDNQRNILTKVYDTVYN